MNHTSPQSREGLLAWRSLALTLILALLVGAGAVAALAQGQKPDSPQPPAQAQTPAKPAPKTAPSAANPPSSGADSSIISDFDDGKITARSGFGWSIATDSIMGGQSTADMKVAEG